MLLDKSLIFAVAPEKEASIFRASYQHARKEIKQWKSSIDWLHGLEDPVGGKKYHKHNVEQVS